MKILNKREFQQIAIDNSSDIDFKDFKSTTKLYCLLVNYTTLASDIPLCFRCNLLKIM